MLTLDDRLGAREDEIAAKVMEGEAILINLVTGIYYSMDKVGGLIWELVEKKHTLEEMVQAVVGHYLVPRDQAEADVLRLAEELLREDLVALVENGAMASGKVPAKGNEREAYEAPKLNVYREMGDLIALDPPTPGLYSLPWKEPDEESSK